MNAAFVLQYLADGVGQDRGSNREAIRVYLQTRPEGTLRAEIADGAGSGVNKNNFGPLLARMLREQVVVRCRLPGDKANTKRWRLWPAGPLTLAQAERLPQGVPAEDILGAQPESVDSSTSALLHPQWRSAQRTPRVRCFGLSPSAFNPLPAPVSARSA
jgi:hypothetical protein